ncbi:hypothetical protein EVAR_62537_1 [Eumeta japonica]|uniref:Uncharacterized protein n=1 Tax=Eumeta variegata TaxID=151549 RepID=A0A4C1ZDA6_EUMVA|nr:hypothetical protein EVAR_62537_1 [Eumeta japonica]
MSVLPCVEIDKMKNVENGSGFECNNKEINEIEKGKLQITRINSLSADAQDALEPHADAHRRTAARLRPAPGAVHPENSQNSPEDRPWHSGGWASGQNAAWRPDGRPKTRRRIKGHPSINYVTRFGQRNVTMRDEEQVKSFVTSNPKYGKGKRACRTTLTVGSEAATTNKCTTDEKTMLLHFFPYFPHKDDNVCRVRLMTETSNKMTYQQIRTSGMVTEAGFTNGIPETKRQSAQWMFPFDELHTKER